MITSMNLRPAIIAGVLLAGFGGMALADGPPAWQEKFKTYEQGQPIAVLAEARRQLFPGTEVEAVRKARQDALLDFIASDAHPQARAIAIEWLGILGDRECLPGLEKLAADAAMAAPVAAAIQRITRSKESRPEESPPVANAAAADTRKFLAALAIAPSSPAADTLIAGALASPHDLPCGAALRRIRAGDGTSGLPGKLLASLDGWPAHRQNQVLDALSERPGSGDLLRPVLRRRLETGDATARAALLPVFGLLAVADDVPWLLEFPGPGESDVQEAASVAFRRATAPGIDGKLLEIANGPDDAAAMKAMRVLVERNAGAAAKALWKIALGQDSPRREAARDALGKLLPVADLPAVWQRMRDADDPGLLRLLGEINWAAARRHPNPAAIASAMQEAASGANPEAKALLERQANRLRSRGDDKPAAPPIKVPLEKDPAPLAPDAHDLLLTLDCGASAEAAQAGVTIRRVAGAAFAFGGSNDPLATVDYGKSVAYEISGLNPMDAHVLALAAWDGDSGGRRQSLEINGRLIVPEFLPLAYHANQPVSARIHLPLDGMVPPDGKVRVQVDQIAGPNAVVSELRLYRRLPRAEAGKKILILTGDDYPGHLWRETGPELAAILRADPRLEVTVSESPYLLGAPEVVDHYDTLIIHFKNFENRTPSTVAMRENLTRYVAGGGGLVVAHFGCGAMQEWDGFVRVAGRIWDPQKCGHDPYGEFLVRFTDRSHPLVSGLADFKTTDELYTCLTGTTEVRTLAVATSKVDKQDHPMAMVHLPGKGRVFHTPLGHDLRAFQSPGTRSLYLRGTQWAAGLDARDP